MTSVTDIICPMYRFPNWCLRMSKTDTKKRPVILCEYAHAMGNSGGGLEDYWELFYSNEHPRMQGLEICSIMPSFIVIYCYLLLLYLFILLFIYAQVSLFFHSLIHSIAH